MAFATQCRDPIFGMLRLALLLLLSGWMMGCGSKAPQAPPTALGGGTAPGKAESGDVAEEPPTNSVRVAAAIFELVPGGKDPFFPNSTRIPSAAVDSPEAEVKPRLPLSSYLKVTGLRPNGSQPLALINGNIFGPGEEGTVEVVIQSDQAGSETRVVKIECLEIRVDSVLIRVEGEPGVKNLSPPPRP